MGRYLMLWEMDQSKISVDVKERGTAWSFFVVMLKQDRELGILKDWGACLGEARGYIVCEGKEVEVDAMLQKYHAYATFKVNPVLTIEHLEEVSKIMIG